MSEATDTQPHIRVSSVSASFGPFQVIGNISLDIREGEIVSIIGRSGVGKSTLLRLVAGLHQPASGSVMVDGSPASEARAAKHFGFMPQVPSLLPWRSVAANVDLPNEVNRKAMQAPLTPTQALNLVGLAHRANDRPSDLSGGMQHRVALARAVATGAPVLLLDEPFASVDEYTRQELYTELMDIVATGGHTVVLVTHNITEAALLSDRVVVLSGAPAQIAAEVTIVEDRPRTAALDEGRLASTITRLRELLSADPS